MASEGEYSDICLLSLKTILDATEPWQFVGPGLWGSWVEALRGQQLLTQPVSELATLYHLSPSGNLLEPLEHYLTGFPFSEISVDSRRVLIVLVARLATLERGLPSKPLRIDEAVFEKLRLDPDPVSRVTEEEWHGWTSRIKASNRKDLSLGFVADGLGQHWPTTRSDETLNKYLDFDLADLPSLRAIGQRKMRTIILCVAYEALQLETEGPSQFLDAGGSEGDTTGREIRHIVDDVLAKMKTSDREVIERRFGLVNNYTATLEEIAVSRGVSRERIRQIEARILKKLIRNHRLVSELSFRLNRETEIIWEQLATQNDVVLEEVFGVTPLAKRLSPEYRFAFAIVGVAIDAWLDQHAKKVGKGWHRSSFDRYLLERLIHRLEHSADITFPIEVDFLAPMLDAPTIAVRLAASLSNEVHLYQGYLWRGKLMERGRRAIWLHRILSARNKDPYVTTQDAVALHNQVRPRSQCSFRDADIVLCRYRHLFWPMGNGAWVAAGGNPLFSIGPSEDDEPSQSTDDTTTRPETAIGRIREILIARGPRRMGDLMKEFERTTEYSRSTLPTLLITTGEFIRIAPGYYALTEHLDDPKTVAKARETLLTPGSCGDFVRARMSGERHSSFPLWDTKMEHLWCRWASNHAEKALYHSLLAVVEPDKWEDVPPDTVTDWKNLKEELASYGLDVDLSIPFSTTEVQPTDLLAPIVSAAREGTIGWIGVNRLLSRRLNDSRGSIYLAIMMAAGLLELQRDWRCPHIPAPRAHEFSEALLQELHRTGQLSWDVGNGEHLLELVLQGLNEAPLGWVDEGTARAIELSLPTAAKRSCACAIGRKPASEAAIQLGIAIALADGRIVDEELECIRKYAKERLTGLSAEDRARVEAVIINAQHSDIDPLTVARAFAQKLPCEEREELITHLFEIAGADGVFCQEEAAVLSRMQEALNIDPEYFDALRREHSAPSSEMAHLLSNQILGGSEKDESPGPNVDELLNLLNIG